MTKSLTDLPLIRELEPVAEAELNQHLAATKNWNPHDYVPWSDGSSFAALGGHTGIQNSPGSRRWRVAMITNLLTRTTCRPITARSRSRLDDAWGW
jgi:acyl-[acyl-carrier-protein] desaturase